MRRGYRRGKPGSKYVFLLLLVSMITLGYSAIASTLVVDGTAKIDKTTWDVHYENVRVTTGSVEAATPQILDDTTIKYAINFSQPGEFYEFKFDVVNAGSIDAVINNVVQPSLSDVQKQYLTYSSFYEDGNLIKVGDELRVGKSNTIVVRLEMKSDVDASDLPSDGDTVKMRLETEYVQYGSNSNLLDWNEDGVLKVLTIGNSFSQDATTYTYQIGKDLGIENIEMAYLYIGGCSLATHLSNATNDSASYIYYRNTNGTWNSTSNYKISDAVASTNWDYIVFQQASTNSGEEYTYDSLIPLMEKVKESISEDANPKFVWHMTWAYQEGYAGLNKYGNSQMTMYNGIINSVKNKVLTNSDISIIIPDGTAIQNARTALGDTLNRDGTHLSLDGKYIAGLMYIKSLTGASINNISYVTSGGSSNLKDVAIKSVNAAYNNPFKVTTIDSTQGGTDEPETPDTPEVPELGECDATEGYTCLNLEFVQGFRNSQSGWDILDSHSLTGQYWTTQLLTKDDIPNGSIIKLADGWEYRPEGWAEEGKRNDLARPGVVKSSMVVVDDTWWSYYNYRCFNTKLQNSENIWDNYTADDLKEVLKIYVPIDENN